VRAAREFQPSTPEPATWLRADLAIVKAWRADPAGNLMFRKTARNFNPNMAPDRSFERHVQQHPKSGRDGSTARETTA
jgi:hypothetical protein